MCDLLEKTADKAKKLEKMITSLGGKSDAISCTRNVRNINILTFGTRKSFHLQRFRHLIVTPMSELRRYSQTCQRGDFGFRNLAAPPSNFVFIPCLRLESGTDDGIRS